MPRPERGVGAFPMHSIGQPGLISPFSTDRRGSPTCRGVPGEGSLMTDRGATASGGVPAPLGGRGARCGRGSGSGAEGCGAPRQRGDAEIPEQGGVLIFYRCVSFK